MKFVFDHTHYVPVLRLKGAEKGALRNLVPAVSARITPLLELVSTKNNSPRKIADDVRRSWGPAPFFLDDMNYPESTDGNALARFISAMRSHDGASHIVETKGLEDVNVSNKDRAARLWCENTTTLTGKEWSYLKVLQTEFKQLQPTAFSDLNALRAQSELLI